MVQLMYSGRVIQQEELFSKGNEKEKSPIGQLRPPSLARFGGDVAGGTWEEKSLGTSDLSLSLLPCPISCCLFVSCVQRNEMPASQPASPLTRPPIFEFLTCHGQQIWFQLKGRVLAVSCPCLASEYTIHFILCPQCPA